MVKVKKVHLAVYLRELVVRASYKGSQIETVLGLRKNTKKTQLASAFTQSIV